MKITNRLRSKYAGFTDKEIMDIVEWNRQYNWQTVKEVGSKIILGILYAILGCLIALLSSSIIITIINCFI